MHRKSQSTEADEARRRPGVEPSTPPSQPETPGAVRPPRLAELLVRASAPVTERDAIAGDLEEEYRHIRRSRGGARARLWYWSQAARSIAPGFRRPRVDFDHAAPDGRMPQRGGTIMSFADLHNDFRWALRSLARTPGFLLVAVSTLALAIGVNSAIFSMVGALYFTELPITNTEEFAFFFLQNPEQGAHRRPMSAFEFHNYREGVPALREMVAVRDATAILSGAEAPMVVTVAEVTPGLTESWGTPPHLGRDFRADEAQPGADPVAILSHGFWQRRFAGDPDIVGRTIQLDAAETTIIGVMSDAFEFADMARTELWRPLYLPPNATPSSVRNLFVSGLLAEGANHVQAQVQAEAVARRMAAQFPQSNAGWMPRVQSFNDGLASDDFWPIMTVLTITVGFVMLMACSGIASMMLARGAARGREIAVRAALGAGRLRLVRGLLAEGAIIAFASAALGLVVTRGCLSALLWISGDNSNFSFFLRMLGIDGNVLAFTVIVAVLSPLLFSLLPAVRVTRHSLVETLKSNGGGASSGIGAFRARRALVGGQVALALSLMIVAGVLMQTLVQVRAVDLGYDTESMLTMRIDLPEGRYGTDQQRRQFYREALTRIRTLPEIEAAAWVSRRPIAMRARTETFGIGGRREEEGERAPWAGIVAADPAYFELVNLRLVRGRWLRPEDTETGLPVALINEDVADRYWPDVDPIGQQLLLGSDADQDRWLHVVGVVTDLPTPNAAAPTVYVPLEQRVQPGMALMARTRGEALAATNAIRTAVSGIDPEQPLADVRTMQQIFADAVAPMDAILSTLSAFALFALAMAAAGIYGVMSVLVTQRTREFGIRMALGADRGNVRAMVLRGSVFLVVGGALAGLTVGFALARFLASAISDISAFDPLVYGAVALALVVVAFASLWLPTRRATRVDPLVALQTE